MDGSVHCREVHYILVYCSAVQCSAVKCSAVQCSAVQCSDYPWAYIKLFWAEESNWCWCSDPAEHKPCCYPRPWTVHIPQHSTPCTVHWGFTQHTSQHTSHSTPYIPLWLQQADSYLCTLSSTAFIHSISPSLIWAEVDLVTHIQQHLSTYRLTSMSQHTGSTADIYSLKYQKMYTF